MFSSYVFSIALYTAHGLYQDMHKSADDAFF